MLSTPRRRTLWYWGGPILVTLLAAVLRFWNLGHPQALIFDETYYVKDAWTLLQNGYESSWPEGADEDFARGDTGIYEDGPAYVVHPPLGKWMISLGMAAFGAGDAFWWRASTALAGTVAVFVLAMVARRLWPSTIVAVIAALLLAVDGNAIVMSRVALLDNWVMLFALLGFWFVLLDRDHSRRQLERRLDEARGERTRTPLRAGHLVAAMGRRRRRRVRGRVRGEVVGGVVPRGVRRSTSSWSTPSRAGGRECRSG